MKRSLTVPRAGLIAALAGVIALAGVATGQAQTGLPSGKENTLVIVQNAGNADADIAMDVYTPGGEALPSASRAATGVAPGGIAQFPQAVNENLDEGFRGVGVLSADQPINALLVRDILRSASTEAKSYSLANATNDGGHELAAPMLFNQLNSSGRWWNSRITVVNVGTSLACVRATYTMLDSSGSGTGTAVDNGPGSGGCDDGYAIAAGAQITFSPESGDTGFPSETQDSQLAGYFEVTNATSSNRIAAVVDIYRSDGNRLLGGYNALVSDTDNPEGDDVGTDINAPIAMKSVSGFYTVINVMNLNRDSSANVEIEYIGRLDDGRGEEYSHTVNLGSVSEGAFHSTYQLDDMPLGFIGYARITSDQPVAVSVVRGKQTSPFSGVNEAGYAVVNGISTDKATTNWSSPIYFRRYAPGAAGTVGYNSWVQIQVADGSTANVTLRYVGDPTAGCPEGPYELNATVDDTRMFLANEDGSPESGFPSNAPHCFFGGLEVEADKDVIVISQVGADKFPGGDSEGVTNAFPLD